MSITPELWDFPHTMTLKVMGKSCHDLRKIVLHELNALEIEHQATSCNEKMSGKGNFISVSVPICVKNKQEVEGLYGNLSKKDEVKMVL